MLTAEQKCEFKDNGFIILPDFKSCAEITALKFRANEIAASHDFDVSKEVFSTDRQRGPQADRVQDYFLGSANEIRCFFEEKAFGTDGSLVQPLEQSINKIGHAMHDLDPVFHKFSHGDKLAELAADVGLSQTQIWQSMYIFKQPRIGGEVGWHQDTGFFYTTPQSVTTFWFAVDDATLENGCIWVEPGGHKSSLRQQFTRDGRQTKLIDLDTTPWPNTKSAVPVEVKAGTLVCFNGMLPHYSAPNTSDHARHAYTLHVTDGACRYAPENWIQRSNTLPVCGFV
ncbi:MAG: phytanoyl-CoA dioxygenase [Robiginitomaculum sp.]|nr:MAG: phytanoyl-CoA dioxygenase [Robiginitomaculum sp.]